MKFQDVKFKDTKFKHESVLRIDMKHSYFSNYFIICLQSVVEIILNCLLFAKKLFMFMHIVLYKEILKNRINFVYELVHRNIVMYIYTCMPFIHVDMHLKTILAVSLL